MSRPKSHPFWQIPGRSTTDRLLPYGHTLSWALVIGLFGGLIATLYYMVLKGGIHLVWDVVRPWISSMAGWAGNDPYSLIATTFLGGGLVGWTVHRWKAPGEISAVVNNIHIRQGRMDVKQNRPMIVNSLTSIMFGGSAGPEAPLVQIIGSCSGWLAEKLRLHSDLIRTFTFCGMAAALGAFFGAPIGGALFALEIPHNRGLEYYEAIIPSVISALGAFVVFRLFIGYEGALYNLPMLHDPSMIHIFEGVLTGLLGAGLAILFIWIFRQSERVFIPLRHYPIASGLIGGLAIGLFAALIPADFVTTPLFWSEFEIVDLLQGVPSLESRHAYWPLLGLLLATALLKMLSIGFTLHSGFRGGFIFPLFFIGAVSGVALSIGSQGWFSMPVAIVGLMAAVTVGVTKTPVSTSVILTSLTGSALLPVIAASSLVSYVCTEKFRLIPTQQHRKDNPSPMHRVWRWNED